MKQNHFGSRLSLKASLHRGALAIHRHQVITPAIFSLNENSHDFFRFIEFHRTVNALPDEANPNTDKRFELNKARRVSLAHQVY